MPLSPAVADLLVIDDFESPDPRELVLDPLPAPLTLVQTESPTILGGQRDVLLQLLGPPSPYSVSASIGYDVNAQSTLLEIATAGNSGSRVTLRYDGVDFADSVDDGLDNALDLSADLTDGGRNDAFAMTFAFTDGVDPQGLRVDILATSPTGGSLTYWGYVPTSNDPATFLIPFSEFTRLGDATFANVDSLKFIFNVDAIPNVDFAIDTIATVPEPGTPALLALAVLSLLLYRNRRSILTRL